MQVWRLIKHHRGTLFITLPSSSSSSSSFCPDLDVSYHGDDPPSIQIRRLLSFKSNIWFLTVKVLCILCDSETVFKKLFQVGEPAKNTLFMVLSPMLRIILKGKILVRGPLGVKLQ